MRKMGVMLSAFFLTAAASAPIGNLTVVFWYPASQLGGQSLFIRGNSSALSWGAGLPASEVGGDQFAVTIPLQASDYAPNVIAFKALVGDSAWQTGANELVSVPLPASGADAAYTIAAYPWFGSQPGRYEYQRDIYSPQLDNTRDLVIYLPGSYDENPYRLFYASDVLVMHDGQNLLNVSTSTFGCWLIQDTLDPLIYNGTMRDIIVVGVDNAGALRRRQALRAADCTSISLALSTPSLQRPSLTLPCPPNPALPFAGAARTYEYTYDVDPTVGDGGGADLYLDFLEQTVLPFVQTVYRIVPSGRPAIAALPAAAGKTAASTQLPAGSSAAAVAAAPAACDPVPPRWAMLGSSLGGLLSCYAGWTRPDVWSGFVGCMSSSFWWNNESFNNTILKMHAPGVFPPVVAVYLDSGNAGPDDDDFNQTLTVRNRYLGMGWAYGNDTWAPVKAEARPLGYYVDNGGQHNVSSAARVLTYCFPLCSTGLPDAITCFLSHLLLSRPCSPFHLALPRFCRSCTGALASTCP